MKKLLKYIMCLVSVGMVLGACSDEVVVETVPNEGDPITVQMTFGVPERNNIVVSRTSEEAVTDLYLFICNLDGRVEDRYYFRGSGVSEDGSASLEYGTSDMDKGTLKSIRTTVGVHRIFAVANCGGGAAFDIKAELDRVDNIEDYVATMRQNTVNRVDNTYLMAGEYTGEDGKPTSVTITSGTTELAGLVKVKRIDAKVNFTISCGRKDGTTFTPKSWQVVNVPTSAYLIEKAYDETAHSHDACGTNGASYFNTVASTTFSQENGFDFYMPENRKKWKNIATRYPDRAKYEKEADGKNKAIFANAPECATYVIITGEYVGKSDIAGYGGEQDVFAEVSYMIFLGDTRTDNNNYQTKRNTKYAYIVTVNGVNDISVEVKTTTDEEPRPDAEGDIMVAAGGEVKTVDAHYGTVTLTFYQKNLLNQNDNFFQYFVYTPFHKNISSEDGKTENAEWVQFVRNRRGGDGKYKSTFESFTLAYQKTHKKPLSYESSEEVNELITIDDLLRELKEKRTDDSFFDADGKVVYTVYIDEYYYKSRPGNTQEEQPLWKEFVNTDNRKMMILASTQASKDEQSTVTEATYVISQKAIQTFYNPENKDLKTAFGIEVMEEGTTEVSDTEGAHHGSDHLYGRNNAFSSGIIGLDWSDVIDYETGELKNEYKYSYAACVQRNRDLNGDNKIDEDEVRWYLPTIYQYQAVFIGNYGLSPETRLYYNQPTWYYKHYISSNYLSNSSWSEILWAEEGCSNGESNKSFANKSKFRFRCARNLGTYGNEYEDYITYIAPGTKGNKYAIFEYPYMNSFSLRQDFIEKEVGEPYTTFSEGNKPYKKIEVQSINSEATGWQDEEFKANANGTSICSTQFGEGWRIPTMSELALIKQKMDIGANIITRTKFEYWDVPVEEMPSSSKKGRYGYFYTDRLMLNDYDAANTNRKGVVRCVRDIK